jgi:hypothetical protein
MVFDDMRQVLADDAAARAAEDIPNKQNAQSGSRNCGIRRELANPNIVRKKVDTEAKKDEKSASLFGLGERQKLFAAIVRFPAQILSQW